MRRGGTQNYQATKLPNYLGSRLERVSVVVVHRLSFVMSDRDERMEGWKHGRNGNGLRTDKGSDDGNGERLGIKHPGSKGQGF